MRCPGSWKEADRFREKCEGMATELRSIRAQLQEFELAQPFAKFLLGQLVQAHRPTPEEGDEERAPDARVTTLPAAPHEMLCVLCRRTRSRGTRSRSAPSSR